MIVKSESLTLILPFPLISPFATIVAVPLATSNAGFVVSVESPNVIEPSVEVAWKLPSLTVTLLSPVVISPPASKINVEFAVTPLFVAPITLISPVVILPSDFNPAADSCLSPEISENLLITLTSPTSMLPFASIWSNEPFLTSISGV